MKKREVISDYLHTYPFPYDDTSWWVTALQKLKVPRIFRDFPQPSFQWI